MILHVPNKWDVFFQKKKPCGAYLDHQKLEKHNRNSNISKSNDSGSYSDSYPSIWSDLWGNLNEKATRIGLEVSWGVDLGCHAGFQGGDLLWNVEYKHVSNAHKHVMAAGLRIGG